MLKRFLVNFLLGCVIIVAASCTTKTEPKDDSPTVTEVPAPKESPPTKPDPREITVQVDGMSEQLKLI